MSKATNVGLGLGLLVLSGVALAGPGVVAAQALTGASNLSNIHTVQQLSIANDGLYSPSLDSLVNGGFGMGVSFSEGSRVAYLVNSGRSHYVAVTALPSGGMTVSGDENRPVVCAEYTAECLTQVTTDAELLTAVPHWVTF